MLLKLLPKNLAIFTVWLIASFTYLFFITLVHAEGSYELIKSGGGYRPYLHFANYDTVGIKLRNNIKVFVKANEQVNVGSSVPNSANGNADIVYYWPGNKPPLVGGEPVLPNQTADNKFYNSFDVDASTCGLIDTLFREKIGPNPDQVGYYPCSFIAQETGIYEIEFHAPLLKSNDPSRDKPDPVKPVLVTEPFPIDDQQKQAVAAWDVTVFQTPNDPSTEQMGRAYATFLPLDTGIAGGQGGKQNPLTPILYSQVYFLHEHGYLYHVKLNGLDPSQFLLFSNNKGFQDDFGNSLYTSVEFSQLEKQQVFLHDPSKPDTETNTTHKIFFNVPSSDLPLDSEVPIPSGGSTWLRSTPPALPQIENFQFIGEEETVNQTGTWPLTGSFYFDTNTGGDYIITLDNNINGVFGDQNDRKLKGTATIGQNIISWDGLDGDGQVVPAQTLIYDAALTLSVGTMHFPLLDVENNPNGLIISLVNCEQLPCIMEDNTVFYDNSGLNLGTNTKGIPDPISATSGIDSSNGAQKFSDEFGESRGIDTWTVLATKPLIFTGDLELKEADLSVSKTHDTSIKLVPGGSITYLITVHNAGPSHVEGIQVQDNLPATITDPFWTCEVTESAPEPTIQNRCAANNVEGPLNTTVDLQNGATATFLVEATISASVAEGDTIDNSVTVTRPPDVTNPAGDQLDVKIETATIHSVILAPLTNEPPVAEDKEITTIYNDNPVQIPALSAQDSDGTVASYKIFQLPSKSKGLLYLGNPTTGGTLITEGQSITLAQVSSLYFQPNHSFSGKAQFNYKAIDDKGAASNIATVTINPANQPPNQPPIADPKMASVMANDVIRRLPALSGRDEDGEIVSFTVITLPTAVQGILYLGDPSMGGQPVALEQKLTLNEGSALFFKPKPNTTGEVTFNYLTTDDRGADSTLVLVTILVKENQPPIAADKEIAAIPNNITVVLPALSAVDSDGTIEFYQITTLPPITAGIVYLSDPTQGGAPLFIGKVLTPEEAKLLYFRSNFEANLKDGDVLLTYIATDNHGAISNTATVKIAILALLNEPPIANNDSANIAPNTPVMLPILNNDSDPDGDLDLQSVTITTLPPNGRVTVNSNSTITYLPNSGFTTGVDTFIYQVCDTGTLPQCDTATIAITISTQLAPIADNLAAPLTLNNTIVLLPTLSAQDPDGTVTTYTIATLPLPTQGILYLGDPSQEGSKRVTVGEKLSPEQVSELFFQPDNHFIGQASFIYTATDNVGAISNAALVTIPVRAPVNSHPLANDDYASTDPNTSVIIAVLNNDSELEGQLDPSQVHIISPPSHGQITINPDVTMIYTPHQEFTIGLDIFSYEVCDLGTPSQCDTAQVTVSVPALTIQPPIAHDKKTPPTPNNETVAIPALSAESESIIVSYTITTLPFTIQGTLYLGNHPTPPIFSGQVLIPTEAKNLFFQPDPNWVGEVTFDYQAADDQGNLSDIATVTIPVILPPTIVVDDDQHEEALFSGKIWSSGGKVGKQLSIDAPEYIKVTGYIQPSVIHIGQLADIIVTYHWIAHYDESSLTLPVIIASQQRLAAEMEIALFEGYLIGLAGQFDLSLGYQLNTGELKSAPILTLIVRPNRTPTALTLSHQTVPEYSLTDTLIGAFSTRDPDQQEQFHYGLVENPDDYFKVVGKELRVNRSLPSREEQPSYSITVRSVDKNGGYIEQPFLINVLDTETKPQELHLTQHTVLENSPSDTIIGRLWTQDPKPGHYSYELIDPAHGPFMLKGDLLLVAPEARLDFETQSTYAVTVRSWKSEPPDSLEKTFTIELLNQIEVTVLAKTLNSNRTPVEISMKLLPDLTHQGEPAEFMSVMVWQPFDSKETFMYRLTGIHWVPWYGELAELSSGQVLTLTSQHEITLMFDPSFDLSNGKVNLFVGYQLPTGEIFYTEVPW